MVSDMDDNKDGYVDKAEAMYAVVDALDAGGGEDPDFRKAALEFMQVLYDVADVDGDGLLNPKEIEFAELLADTACAHVRPGDKLRTLEELSGEAFGLAAAQEAMRRTDRNGDGVVDEDEWMRAAKRGLIDDGWSATDLEQPHMQEMLEAVWEWADVNEDGVHGTRELQYSGFMVGTVLAAREASMIMEGAFDTDGDGFLTRNEILANAAETSRLPGDPTTLREHLLQKFDAADLDRDGSLDPTEIYFLAAVIVHEGPSE